MAHYQFVRPPLLYNPAHEQAVVAERGAAYDELQADYAVAFQSREAAALAVADAADEAGSAAAMEAFLAREADNDARLLSLAVRVPLERRGDALRAIAPILDAAPNHVDLMMDTVPLRGNATIGDLSLTRGLTVFEPASHGLLLYRNARQAWEHPVTPPFVARDPVNEFEGPIEDAQRQMLNFFETWRSGAAEVAAPSTLDV